MGVNGGFVPNNPDSRASNWMHTVEQRLEVMETQQRLFKSSVKGGAMTVYDDDLNQVGRLGVGGYTTPDSISVTNPVFAMNNPIGQFIALIDVDQGWLTPKFQYNFVADDFIPVAAASYANTWKSNININGHGLELRFLVTVDAATTGRVKLDLGGIDSDVVLVTALQQVVIRYAWDLTNIYTLGDSPTLRIRAQRDTGTGNINVYSPDRCFLTGVNQISGITAGGQPV